MNVLGFVMATLAALGGLSGVVALLYIRPTYRKLHAEAKKAGAEASEVVAQGATLLLVPLQARIVELSEEVSKLRAQLNAMELTLAMERQTSQEERRVSQQTIVGLKEEIMQKDRRILELQLQSGYNGQTPERGDTR